MYLRAISLLSKRYSSKLTLRTKSPIVKETSAREKQLSKRTFSPFPFAVTEENKVEIANGLVAPLLTTPYQEQLVKKEAYCRQAFRRLAQELYKSGTPIRLNVSRLPCKVNSIVPSDELENYRNKDEFSIWRGIDGKTATVGYMAYPIGKHGDTVCIEPDHIKVLKPATTSLAKILQEFIRHKAKEPVCFSLGTTGGWRRFAIRTNLNDEVMLTGVLSPTGMKVQQVIDERTNFKDYIVRTCKENNLNLTSLYFQPCPFSFCSHDRVPFELLYGEDHLIEQIGQFVLAITPDTHLPARSKGAELLYATTLSMIQECFTTLTDKPLILNIGCRSGLLPMHMAQIGRSVIGIDHDHRSVEISQKNAQMNNIDNIEFICSVPEMVIEKIVENRRRHEEDILVVCHPTKRGLHRHTLECIRKRREITKLVFICPSMDSSILCDNLFDLCTSKSLPGKPFVPIMATPVDLCPHVESYETVIILEKVPT